MMSKSILTIEVKLASSDIKSEIFMSKASLLDWDIVLFKPNISGFLYGYPNNYMGKPSLDDTMSFKLKECCEHWRREIKQAIENGKTIVVFMTSLCEVYIDTGTRNYSGTGRNRQTTRVVEKITNYNSIPLKFTPITSTGNATKLTKIGT
ncbi:MAG: hypothetical protein WCC64_15750, partial [Aliidongia sp.]